MVFAGDHSKDRTTGLAGRDYFSGEWPWGDTVPRGRASMPWTCLDLAVPFEPRRDNFRIAGHPTRTATKKYAT